MIKFIAKKMPALDQEYWPRLTQNERKDESESNLEKILELEKQIQDLKQRNELKETCDQHDINFIDSLMQ